MRIVLTGGGTGGHFFPTLAVARELKNIVQNNLFEIPPGEGTNLELMFLGPKTIGEELLDEEGIVHKKIIAGKIRRYFSWLNIFDIFKIPFGFLQSLWYLFWFMPNVIFSKGGYGSVPIVLAAWLYRIPVLIHESDLMPGLANKFCSKFSKRIAISFPEAANYFPAKKTALCGNPVRQELLGGSKEGAKTAFPGLNGSKSIILILGGSQGAQAINNVIQESLTSLLEHYEIIHQCGSENFEGYKSQFNGPLPTGYFLLPFLDETQLKAAYGAADLIISRAGAGTIAEIAALGKPSMLVPLPTAAGDHQHKNALAFSQAGASVILEQENLTPHLLENQISILLSNPQTLQKMSANAKNFNPLDAARKISQELLNIAKW